MIDPRPDRLKAAPTVLTACAAVLFACGEGPTGPSLASVTVTPTPVTLVSAGETVQLTATVLDDNGTEIVGATFTWTSSDETVATTDTSGLVTAVATGAATITATTDGVSGAAAVAVCIACPLAVLPTDTLVMAGDTVRFRGVALDDEGDTIPGVAFTWQAGAADVATVDDEGLVHAVGVGVTAIRAFVGSDTADALFAVGIHGGPPPLYDHIAFSFQQDIWVIRPDGSNPVNLTRAAWGPDSADHQSAGSPAWSPDATQFAFVAKEFDQPVDSGDVYVVNTAGVDPRRLTHGAGVETITWAPGGSRIAFSSYTGAAGSETWGDLYVMHADGSEPVNLTPGTDRGFYPAWSPDGTRIAFVTDIGSTRRDIYVMESDGTNRVRLTHGDSTETSYGEPAWSPDGSRIALWVSGGGLGVMDSDGSNLQQLTLECCGGHPSWSPDGSRIVFWALTPGSSYELLVIGSDGSNLVRLAPGWTTSGRPVWSRGP